MTQGAGEALAETPPVPLPGAPDTTDWENPPRTGPADGGTGAPVLAVEGFAGPLDWLVEMAVARRIDLRRLPFLALVEAFAGALERAIAAGRGGDMGSGGDGVAVASEGRADLARWGTWLVMAARLAELRSHLLLPEADPERRSAEAEAERLRCALAGRVEIAAAVDWLERQPLLGRDVFARGRARSGGSEAADETGALLVTVVVEKAGSKRAKGPVLGDITGLLRACLVALQLPPEAGGAWQPGPPPWSAADARARILRTLGDAPGTVAFRAVLPGILADAPRREWRCRMAVAVSFAAGLELARDGTLALEQQHTWGEIHVSCPKPDMVAGAASAG